MRVVIEEDGERAEINWENESGICTVTTSYHPRVEFRRPSRFEHVDDVKKRITETVMVLMVPNGYSMSERPQYWGPILKSLRFEMVTSD